MNLHVRANIWSRKRNVGHSGAVRTAGDLEEENFIPRGPEDLTPTRENICTRCDLTQQQEVNSVLLTRYRLIFLHIQASKVSDKMLELLRVMDSMDIEEEEEVELLELDEEDEVDSGLESSEENYMNIEIFA